MKAAIYHDIHKIHIEDIPVPTPDIAEALLKVEAAGICGTDLRIYNHGHPKISPGTPRILGHEFAGEIVALGGEIPGLRVGMRVGVAPNIGCGICDQCIAGWTNLCENYRAFGIHLNGAFAEYILICADAVRQGNITPINDEIPSAWAALAEPLSCCLNGQEAVGVGAGDTVLIIGAGPIGLMHVVLAKLKGARQVLVSEVSETRLQLAASFDPDFLINPAKQDIKSMVMGATNNKGVSVVIVAAPSSQAQQQALELVGQRGRINYFGGLPKGRSSVDIDTNLIHYKHLIVTGTTGQNLRQYRTIMNLIQKKKVNIGAFASASLPIEQIQEGIERSVSAAEMRIIITPFCNVDSNTPS